MEKLKKPVPFRSRLLLPPSGGEWIQDALLRGAEPLLMNLSGFAALVHRGQTYRQEM